MALPGHKGGGGRPLTNLNDFPVMVAASAQDKKQGNSSLRDTVKHGPRFGAVARAAIVTGTLSCLLLGGLGYAYWPTFGAEITCDASGNAPIQGVAGVSR